MEIFDPFSIVTISAQAAYYDPEFCPDDPPPEEEPEELEPIDPWGPWGPWGG